MLLPVPSPSQISGLLVPPAGSPMQVITPLADILSIEWGLRRLTLSYTHLTASSLEPILHAFRIPNSLTYLSLEGNTKLKGEASRTVSASMRETKSLKFLDLQMSQSGFRKEGNGIYRRGVTEVGRTGVAVTQA